MLKVLAQGKTTECARGANLREILLQNGIDLYYGDAKVVNWQVMGNYGTCAVQIHFSKYYRYIGNRLEVRSPCPPLSDKKQKSLPVRLSF